MLKRVDPLRNELKSLESQADENKHKAQDIIKVSPPSDAADHFTVTAWLLREYRK